MARQHNGIPPDPVVDAIIDMEEEKERSRCRSQKEADALFYLAWGVIANAGWDGNDKTEGWQEAAVAWRDRYHAYLGGEG